MRVVICDGCPLLQEVVYDEYCGEMECAIECVVEEGSLANDFEKHYYSELCTLKSIDYGKVFVPEWIETEVFVRPIRGACGRPVCAALSPLLMDMYCRELQKVCIPQNLFPGVEDEE